MILTRREFLAATGATAGLAHLSPMSRVSANQDRVPGGLPAASPADELTPGRHRLNLGDDRDGMLYVPRGYKAGVAAPLMVMLHGAGNTSESVAYTFPLADEFGLIVLAPDSRDQRT